MKKYKELLSNIGLLTLSNFGSKLLSFFLIPLYTSVLTTEDYGNFDFITTTISLMIPLFTFNISDSALRFMLDKKKEKYDVYKISINITLFSIILMLFFISINYIFNIFNVINNYIFYFIIYYVLFSIYSLYQNIVRGLDKINILAVSGLLNTILFLILNIVFLVVFKLNLPGFFFASFISNFICIIYLVANVKLSYKKSKSVSYEDTKKEMISYGKPLVLNSIGWWINNVSDRYVVIYFCGAAINGIYSVSYKIPSILTIFQTIFNQAWGISAIKEFDEDSNMSFYQNIYTSYNCMMIFICSFIIICSKLIAKVLYMKDFFSAWIYVPFLLVSVVFGAMSGVIGGIFSAANKTKIQGYTTLIGAFANILLNIVLVYKIGALGAAIATMISYFIVWIIRVIYLKLKLKLKLYRIRDLFSYLVLVVQSVILCLINNNNVYIIESCLFIILLIINFQTIVNITKKIFDLKKERIKYEK